MPSRGDGQHFAISQGTLFHYLPWADAHAGREVKGNAPTTRRKIQRLSTANPEANGPLAESNTSPRRFQAVWLNHNHWQTGSYFAAGSSTLDRYPKSPNCLQNWVACIDSLKLKDTRIQFSMLTAGRIWRSHFKNCAEEGNEDPQVYALEEEGRLLTSPPGTTDFSIPQICSPGG